MGIIVLNQFQFQTWLPGRAFANHSILCFDVLFQALEASHSFKRSRTSLAYQHIAV